MILLDEDQKKALSDWIAYALTKLKCEPKQVELLSKFIHTLIKVDSNTEKIKNSLQEFLEDKTDGFVDELQERLKRKDFSFVKEEQPAPPKKVAPPPKQQETTHKAQIQPSPKQTTESKKEIKSSSSVKQTKQESYTTEKLTKKDEIPSKTKPPQSQQKTQEQIKPQQKPQQQKQPSQQQKSQTPQQQQKQPPQQQKPQIPHHQQQQAHHQNPSQTNSIFDEEDLINDEEDEEPQSDESLEKVQEEKIDSKNLEPPPHYVIFIAGIDRNNSSIQTLFNLFTKYGRILAIEVNEDEKVAYIEFEELLSAFKAIKSNNKKNLFKNAFVQVDYAIRPDPEKLADLELEYNLRKQQRQEKKQQMLQQQLEQQKKETEAKATSANEEILEEEDQIKKDIIQKINDTKELMKKCTDPTQMEELKTRLETFETLISDL